MIDTATVRAIPASAASVCRRLAPAAALVLLSACAGVPDAPVAPPDIAVPPAWSLATPVGGAALADWWRNFDDPVLDQLMRLSLRDNGGVRSAEAALRQARALRDVAGAPLRPALDASGSAQRGKAGVADAASVFAAGLDASWELDLFGANRWAWRAADADAAAGAATLAAVQVSTAAEVALAYIALRGAQARLAIARASLASQRDTLQITDWRVQAGLLTSLEGEQARAASEQTAAQIPVLEASIAQGGHALALLCGLAPAALQAQLAGTGAQPQPRAELAVSLPLDTLRQRPDVAAAERHFGAALARVGQADAARYPDFRLAGSLGLRTASLGALGSGVLTRTILASVSAPLFDGGGRRAQLRAQQALLEQARVAYRDSMLTALQEVEDALAALAGDRVRLLHLRNAAEAAGNADLIARQRFASGLVDFQTVLDTQRSLLSLQDAVAAGSADVGADHVRLYKALGGGWHAERLAALP